MEKLMKLFILLPQPKDTAKLVWAILFYIFVPPIVAGLIGMILGFTVILVPLAVPVGLAFSAYTIMGIVFSIMSYMGQDLPGKKKD